MQVHLAILDQGDQISDHCVGWFRRADRYVVADECDPAQAYLTRSVAATSFDRRPGKWAKKHHIQIMFIFFSCKMSK